MSREIGSAPLYITLFRTRALKNDKRKETKRNEKARKEKKRKEEKRKDEKRKEKERKEEKGTKRGQKGNRLYKNKMKLD